MQKRFLSTLLILCMVFGMVPLEVFAAEPDALAEPKVTALTVSYDGGEPVDLLGNQPTVSLPAGSKPIFTVTFDSTDILNQVFVTSTKDGETKYLEAKRQGAQYITDGYFDPSDTNYIPGTIAVTYSKKAVKVDESGNIGGTDLNTLKTQLSSEGISCRNETTTSDGTVTAQIVLGDLFGAMSDVYFDAAVSEFVAGAGIDQNELNKWLGVYQNLSQLSTYDLESADGKQFTLYLGDGKDFGDADTYLVMVKDATSNKYTKTLLKKAADKAGLGDISEALSSANVVTKKLLEYNAISKETAALREEIEAHPTMTAQEKSEANSNLDALDQDKKLLLIGMTAVSLLLDPVGTPLMISALVAGYSSIADYFWDYRVGLIQGNESPASELAVSGTCGEHLHWSLNGGGTLTISGYGPMTEFSSNTQNPWFPYSRSHIKRVIINSGATSIGRVAFADCYQLTSVSIPDTIESIGESAFRYCRELKEVTIPGSVTTMGAHVFDECDNLKSAGPIGGSYDIRFGWAEEIPANAFSVISSSIENIVIPDGIQIIGDSAFSLTDIEHVQIPESVISIGSYAFANTKLSGVTVPNSVVSIGESAFSGCTNLTNITLSQNLFSIGTNAFFNTGLYNNESNWESNVLYIGDYLIRAKTSVNGDYHVKQGTKCIADQAFDNGRTAMYYDNLTSVIMPSSVAHIGRDAFSSCRGSHGFTGVYFRGNAPTVYDGGKPEHSFYDHTNLFYIEGKEGWDTSDDSEWHGYPIATWEDASCQHTYTSVITAATCTERGFTTYTCSLCGNSYKENFTDVLGHNYGDWVITQNATATANGQRERICSRCSNKETEIIPAIGSSGGGTTGGGSSGSVSTGGNSSTSTPTPPVTTNTTSQGGTRTTETTVTPTATTKGDAATCTVNSTTGNEIVKQAEKNKSDNVVIAPKIKGDVSKTEVAIPTSTVGQIGSKTKANLTVSTPMANVTIPNMALNSLSREGGNVKVTAERTGNTVELSVQTGSKTVDNIPGGVTLAVPVPDTTPGTVAMLVHENGTREVVRKSVAGNESVTIPLDGSAKLEIMDNSKQFSDVPPDSWATNAIAFVSAHELFNGTGSGKFSPNLPMSRGMLAVVLHNLENNPHQVITDTFSDVSNDTWYAEGIAWAAAQRIVSGYEGGRFGPNDNITREQLATILWRYSGSPMATNKELHFNDADKISSYALEAVYWAVENGIINGYGNGQLGPQGLATRAQVAQMLKNYLEK